MNNKLTGKERLHLLLVKRLPCSVCDQYGPPDEKTGAPMVEAHHIKQGSQYLACALCKSCHDALHGKADKAMWRIHKMDEIDALAVTVERLLT